MNAIGIETSGSGPCGDLALIHGWGVGKSAWDELLALLTPHFRVHRVDLPGYGAGAADAPQAPLSFDATAAALAAALPAGCTLCGWSLGAQLALAATYAAPGRFARLLLCGATPCFTRRDDWPTAQAPELLAGFQAAVAGNAVATRQRFVALFNQGDARARAITRTLTRALAAEPAPDAATLARGLDWLRDVDLRAPLLAHAAHADPCAPQTPPTLLIHGAADPLMPLAAAQWLAAALPAARLEVFAGAAHAPFVSDPQRFARLLVDFCHVPSPRQTARA